MLPVIVFKFSKRHQNMLLKNETPCYGLANCFARHIFCACSFRRAVLKDLCTFWTSFIETYFYLAGISTTFGRILILRLATLYFFAAPGCCVGYRSAAASRASYAPSWSFPPRGSGSRSAAWALLGASRAERAGRTRCTKFGLTRS